jgi:hypothetical protein
VWIVWIVDTQRPPCATHHHQQLTALSVSSQVVKSVPTYVYSKSVSKYFNIQPYGMQSMLSAMVASGLPMDEARAVHCPN